SQAAADAGAVGQRNLFQIRPYGGIDRHRPGRQDAAAGIFVGHNRRDGAAESVPQGLDPEKEERTIMTEGTAQGPAKLIPLEVRFLGGIEKVARIEVVVAVKLVQSPVQIVGS